MHHGVRIRRAGVEDATTIARLHVETWQAAYAGILPDAALVSLDPQAQAETWRRRLSTPPRGVQTLIADLALDALGVVFEPVAFGACGPARPGPLVYDGEVTELYVAPDWQGQGLGRQLLGSLFRELYDRGHGDAVIWVLAQNPARFFYEHMGGRFVAQRQETVAGRACAVFAYAWPDLEDWLRQVRA